MNKNKIQSIEEYNYIKSSVIRFLSDVSSNLKIKKSKDLRIILARFRKDGCFKSKIDYNFAMRFYKIDIKHYVKGRENLIKDLEPFQKKMMSGNSSPSLERFLA